MGDDEEGGGGHGQGDVSIPCLVFTDLVVVEPGFVFGGLEAFLDGPAGAGDADQLGQIGVGWAVAEVVSDLVGVGDRAPSQQPVSVSRFAPRPDVDGGPVVRLRLMRLMLCDRPDSFWWCRAGAWAPLGQVGRWFE